MGEATAPPGQPVLVVEDDDDSRDFVAEILKGAGYRVAAAANGAEALEQVEQQSPQVILLDMKMPVMDGWAFAERYHAQASSTAPIIVMTAAHDAAARASQVQAVGVLGKPFDIEDLLAAVARVLHPAA